MSVEQVAHDFVKSMNDPGRLQELITPDALASGGVLPQAMPAMEAPLSLPVPGVPGLPPTGKKESVRDAYVLTVQRDKVSHLHVESPADGGVPAALVQLGVKAPAV